MQILCFFKCLSASILLLAAGPFFVLAESSIQEDQNQEEIELPDWLLENSFRVDMRTELILDGSESANGIKQSSETHDRVRFNSLEDWRVFRQLPYSHASQELLKTSEGVYMMTPSNDKNFSPQEFSHNLWTEVVQAPLKIAERWGISKTGESWAEFVSRMKTEKDILTNIEEDEIRSEYSKSDGVESLRLVLTGKLIHPSQLRYQVKVEWLLEHGEGLDKLKTQSSLRKGGSS